MTEPTRPGVAAPSELSASRRRLFTLLTLLAPLLILAAVEGALRVVGYGEPDALVVPFGPDPDYLQVNPALGRRYFPPEQAPVPGFELLRARRDETGLRLVVQGASTAVGFPYGHHLAFGRMVRAALRRAYPDREVEVVNTAMTAVNSYTLLDLAGEIAALEPDAVLVYAGHNEYYGALGVASAVSVGRSRAVVRAYLRLGRLRTVRLLESLLRSLRPGGAARAGDAPMERVVARERIPLDSDLYRAGVAQYRANLHDLLGFYRARGIPVYIATLVSNLRDLPPFIGEGGEGLDEEERTTLLRSLQSAEQALETGDTAAARAAVEATLRLDPDAADAHFLRGRWLESVGRHGDAAGAYRRARDLDELRFRAPTEFNRVVREEAAEHGATLVDVEAAFEAAAPSGLVGASLLTEHVHPNLDGTRILADAFLAALDAPPAASREAPGGGALAPGPCGEVTPTAVDTVLARYRLQALRASWPFAERGSPPPSFIARSSVEELALELYEGRRLWLEVMNDLGAYYEERGDADGALDVACAMADELIFAPWPLLAAGRLLAGAGRHAEAAAAFRRANRRAETAYGYLGLGASLLRTGRAEEGEAALRRAAALDGRDPRARRVLEGLPGVADDPAALDALLQEVVGGA